MSLLRSAFPGDAPAVWEFYDFDLFPGCLRVTRAKKTRHARAV